MQAVMRGDNHNYIELALSYMSAYLTDDAIEILKLAPNDNEPMVHYYLYVLTNDKSELDKAENSDSLYCFPNRLEDIAVLEKQYITAVIMLLIILDVCSMTEADGKNQKNYGKSVRII